MFMRDSMLCGFLLLLIGSSSIGVGIALYIKNNKNVNCKELRFTFSKEIDTNMSTFFNQDTNCTVVLQTDKYRSPKEVTLKIIDGTCDNCIFQKKNVQYNILIILIIIGSVIVLVALLFILSCSNCCLCIYRNQNTVTRTQYRIETRHTTIRVHPVITPKIDILVDNNTKNKECIICMDISESENMLCKLKKCDCTEALYHESCLKNWLEHSMSCPLCRKEI